MSDSAIKQQLRDMAKLSLLSNRISEIQEKNLTHYPFVFFNEVKTVKIAYDVARYDQETNKDPKRHHVTYYLELDKSANDTNVHMDKRLFCLEEATRVLFWNDLKVIVYINGEKAFESKDVSKPDKKT